MSAALEAALAADAAGLCVLPPKEDGSKAPDAKRWEQYQRERSTDDEILTWYANGRTGLGIVCGAVSGGLEMLEIEGRGVAEGVDHAFRELCEAAGLGEILTRILTGYSERTPGGGLHLLYRVPTPQGNTELASRPATADELAAKPKDKVRVLIETRGEGGYCITAPSNGKVHANGGAWQMAAGSFATITSISDSERDELWRIAQMLDQMPPSLPRPRQRTGDDRPGDRYGEQGDIQAQIVELLERHGWSHVTTRGDRDYLRRPGKEVGISATVGYAGPGVLHNFSTSVAEFEARRSYGPFSVYAILEHNGDFRAAARALEPPPTFTASAPVAAEPIAESWPAPLAAAAYHGVMGELVRAVEAETEADPVALLGSLLAYVGALAGGAVTMHQGSWQAARLFVVLVGDTGTGRKGTAGDAVRDMIRLVDPEFYKIVVPGLGSGEGLVGHMKRLRADGGTETRALLIENELGRLLAVMGRDGSTLSPILRDGWDGTTMGRSLAREEMIVHEHHVGLLGHITVSELRAKLASLDAANGFANRFLWLAVRRPHLIPVPERVDRLVTGLWAPLARALAKAREPRVMTWTADASDAWTTFYIERALRPAYGMLAAVTGRAEAQVARLALTYAIADGADAVGLEHLAAALAMWTYAEQSARYIFGASTGNRHADYLLRLIRGEGEIDWDTARRELGLRTGADMAEAVALLADLGAVTVTPEGREGGGRPRRVLRLANGANGANIAYPPRKRLSVEPLHD